jgi:hypothetical protein
LIESEGSIRKLKVRIRLGIIIENSVKNRRHSCDFIKTEIIVEMEIKFYF